MWVATHVNDAIGDSMLSINQSIYFHPVNHYK